MTNTIHSKSSVQEPTTIILFGAMGDLAWRKLLPSLLDLYNRAALPSGVRIIGASREAVSIEEFKKHIQEKVSDVTDEFLNLLSYTHMDLLDATAYAQLDAEITKLEQGHSQNNKNNTSENVRGNRLFHLAVPPTLYKDIFIHLGESGIAKEIDSEDGANGDRAWSRILVEKPFGYDLASAQELNKTIEKHLNQKQIYRVDHYLAKEAVESIMAFRFSNVIFGHTWNKEHITSVRIRMHEKADVAHRGAFYETVGALRDIGQNHLLQILAIIAMEQPASLDASDVSRARQEVLAALRKENTSELLENTHHAQYRGYTHTDGVKEDSRRETYFMIKAFVDNPTWQDVPFYIEGGKAMPEDKIDITLTFKREGACLCAKDSPAHEHSNVLTFTLKPKNKTEITFWVKEPGIEYALEEHVLSFTHNKEELAKAPDAYADVLYDAITGEKIIFPYAKEVEASWAFIMPILKSWRENKDTFALYDKETFPEVEAHIDGFKHN